MPIKINPVLLVFVFVWILGWQSAKAAVIDDLYDAKIAVDNQSQLTQSKAFRLALEQVLLKVRGNSDLLSNAKIRNSLSKATRFVRSYSYEKSGSQLFLVISFDPQRVANVIRSSGFPVWDKRRPDTLVWLAIQSPDGSDRHIANSTHYPEFYQQLSTRAAQRGITLVYPLWDLDDIQTLSVYDIWGGFSSQIAKASERYVVPSVLSARIHGAISESPEDRVNTTKPSVQWTADWTMIEGGGLLSGKVQQQSQIDIATALIDALADQLSSKYAVDLAQIDRSEAKVQIVVNNIDSLSYYKLALNSLENMSVVNEVTLIKQQGSRATFELDLLGDVGDLTNALSLDSKIRPVVDDFGQPIRGLEFFWVK
ncbi:MAG: DUF2066 domain-containing protein [Paraglaciecola sp.]|uniref:DUF2066 domain-containing protein n=1 Tax=Paraglaciecola sp. TaxID=1920173 RepID=UPI0032972F5D